MHGVTPAFQRNCISTPDPAQRAVPVRPRRRNGSQRFQELDQIILLGARQVQVKHGVVVVNSIRKRCKPAVVTRVRTKCSLEAWCVMSKRDYAAQARTASGINIVLGLWLILSPWVFDYGGSHAVLNSVFVGALIAILAASRLASLRPTVGLSGINFVLALWTIASPWVCGYAANFGAAGDNVILGIMVAVLAIWSGRATLAEHRHPPVTPAH